MPLSPTPSPNFQARTSPYLSAQTTIDQLQDDELDIGISLPSSRGNERAGGKKSPRMLASGGGKRIGKGKKMRMREPVEGECYLLKLPVDLLQVLLGRIPPRSLSALSATCRTLRSDLEDDSIWRQSYIHHFLGEVSPREIQILVHPCGTDERGWRQEALAREAMTERWATSKAPSAMHHLPVGLIHSLSLSYPPHVSIPTKLVVGKNQPRASATSAPTEPTTPSPATKLTHRQKYEALLAATTRPAPYVLSAGLAAGGIVRSDPVSGKLTKGYWGPDRNANFHLRPHLDHSDPPSAVYLPPRAQTYSIWGLLTGTVVHTTMGLKSHASQAGRASSTNVVCAVDDAHEGEVRSVWSEEGGESWVTSGEDGRVKLWRLHPAAPRSGKNSPAGDAGHLECLFTSKPPLEPLQNRSDLVKLRTAQRPDPVILARCDSQAGIVCGVTEDGDLRIWFNVFGNPKEVRVDAGPAESGNPIKRLELDVMDSTRVAVLVHRERAPLVMRWDVNHTGDVRGWTFTCTGAITALYASLGPAASITASPADPASGEEAIGETSTTPPPLRLDRPVYGRFVVTGDEDGNASVFPWDIDHSSEVQRIRTWQVSSKKITAIDSHCSLVAIGSCDGYIRIYDPLPPQPVLLRSFHASHLSPADSLVAASFNFDALYYTPNQIILENDLVVAAIGRKVFCWRAGSGKKREAGAKGKGSGAGGPRGPSRGVDMRSAHRDAEDDHLALQAEHTPTKLQVRQTNMLQNMGLDDPDEAVQYAMMLSMEQREDESSRSLGTNAEGGGGESDGEAEALEAVRKLEEEERRERDEVLELVRRAEMLGD